MKASFRRGVRREFRPPAPPLHAFLLAFLLLPAALPARAAVVPPGHPAMPAAAPAGLPAVPDAVPPGHAPPPHPAEEGARPVLTLPSAVEAALRNHPDLSLFPPALDAAKARGERAALRPNPELEVEVENLEGGFPWTERASPSVRLSQEIEPWRRSPRRRAAEAEASVTLLDRDAARRDVALQARRAFLSAVAANRRLLLAEDSRRLAAALASATSERVAAGAVSPIEATRAEGALAAAEADVEAAGRERSEALRELALALGEEIAPGTRIEGSLDESLSPPPAEPPPGGDSLPPDLARWDAETRRREAVVEAERAAANPSVTIHGGVSRDREEGTSSLLLGFSLPLPLFDRNDASVAEARAEARLAGAERRRAEILRADRLRKARIAMASASREGILVRDRMLAKAGEAYAAVEEGYRLGKFRYVDLIEASGSLVEARKRHLEAVTAHNLARIELESLLEAQPPPAGPPAVPGSQEEAR